ncbi:MAG: ribulose-phosphate 3-epimerase [Eubacteriales bacterium]|nr:ribulose-phosphate 3-epimerase [Eubacteriales bacterium]
MSGKISASMMCAGPAETERYLKCFERNGVEYLHIDIMDGCFVPNYTLGTDYVKALRKLSPIPLDIHLMIERPEEKLDWFDIRPGEYVSVHYESTRHVHRAIAKIAEKGARPMLALNPATPLSAIDYLTDDLAAILIMTVNPGFSGQKMIPQTLGKISDLRRRLDEMGRGDIEIEADGNVSFANAQKMRAAGTGIFVAGTSSIFTKETDTDTAIRNFRDVIA